MKQTGMQAQRYIASIRNPKKKAYATAYHQALLQGKQDSFTFDTDLSFMAKQAVRMNLEDVVGWDEVDCYNHPNNPPYESDD